MKAVIAYQKRFNSSTTVPKSLKLDQEMEKKRKVIVRSFSIARNIYDGDRKMNPSKLEAGAEFLEVIIKKCLILLLICMYFALAVGILWFVMKYF